MLEKKLVQMAVQGLTAEDNPTFITSNCLNAKQRKFPCTLCVDVCPTGVLIKPDGEDADWDKCIGCNLCVLMCPSAAIAPSYEDFKRVLRLLTTKRETRMIACERSDSESDYVPWCLGTVPWELFASLALSGKVILERAACAHCDRAPHLAHFETSLVQARLFLGEDYFNPRVTLLDVGDSLPPVDLTRREALRSLSLRARFGVGTLLPDTQKLENDPLFLRRLLVRQLRQNLEKSETPERLTWASPIVDGSICWACGVCEHVCPHQALKVYLDEEDDQRYLLHTPERCTQCRLCQSICPDKAITGFGYGELPARVKYFLTPVQTTHCTRCSGPMRPEKAGQLCSRCQAITRKKSW
ncbi:MAG: 4Fe-4S binding protein [Fretibacterium sp.]|nr:4Fe-4S binding protein [Fretibacterium sp.]